MLSTSRAQSWEDAHRDEWRGCQHHPPPPATSLPDTVRSAGQQSGVDRHGLCCRPGEGWLCVLGDSSPSELQPTASVGLLGTGRATWAPLGAGKRAQFPRCLLNSWGFSCCPHPPSHPDSGSSSATPHTGLAAHLSPLSGPSGTSTPRMADLSIT